MRVLFLDFDGVLNHHKTPSRWTKDGVLLMNDPECVFRLNCLVDRLECQVVLSSSWRHMDNWRETMKLNGLVFSFLDRTPAGKELGRGKEIKMWLDEHPEVEKYAILDDDTDMLDEQLPNFFNTSWMTGLTQEIADKVEAHLK